MQDSEFLSANKMFEAKCKLYKKEMNPKPTHKSLIAAGDMLKLRGYFSEGLDSNNSWADQIPSDFYSLCGFHFVFILVAAEEKAGQALFQTPNHHFKKAESRWFRNEPLGKNTIAKLTENISSKAELSERYTNHSIRASTITALYQRGVDAKQICAITKHKVERSLSHYISQTTSEQKRQCSRLLQDSRLTFVNTFRKRKCRQHWRSHFSFANTVESFSLFSPAVALISYREGLGTSL